MAIVNLLNVLRPPAAPLEALGTWANIENVIGAVLPNDYRAFIGTYGSGRINEFLWIFNPFSNRETINLESQISARLNALKELARDFGDHCPYPIFPEDSGLLPLGMTDNGDVIYWLTNGVPNDWNIVVNEARGPRYEEFDCDMTSFLSRILTRVSRCSLFPESFPEGVPIFEPK